MKVQTRLSAIEGQVLCPHSCDWKSVAECAHCAELTRIEQDETGTTVVCAPESTGRWAAFCRHDQSLSSPPASRRSRRRRRFRDHGRSCRRPHPRSAQLPLIAAIAAGVVVLDALTKWAATQYLSGEGKVEVLGGLFQFEFYRNFAGPNNLFQGHTVLISLFAILAVVVLVAVAFRVTATLTAVAVGLLLGGALGNLLDRIFREPSPLHGGVVDWLRITSLTKSMNLADLAIDAAIVVMLVAAVVSWGQGEEKRGAEPAAAGRTAVRIVCPAVIAAIPSPSTNDFHVGPFVFHAYGLIYAIAIIVAGAITVRRWEAEGG